MNTKLTNQEHEAILETLRFWDQSSLIDTIFELVPAEKLKELIPEE
jgi:hypothetical protein